MGIFLFLVNMSQINPGALCQCPLLIQPVTELDTTVQIQMRIRLIPSHGAAKGAFQYQQIQPVAGQKVQSLLGVVARIQCVQKFRSVLLPDQIPRRILLKMSRMLSFYRNYLKFPDPILVIKFQPVQHKIFFQGFLKKSLPLLVFHTILQR